MPAALRAGGGPRGLLGMKWVTGYPSNNQLGLPAIHGLVLLSDASTGAPRAILDARPITAQRTAAVSGVAIGRFTPAVSGRSARAALIGAGTQGHSHVPVLGHLLPDVDLRLYDRHPDRAEALAEVARATHGIGRATVVETAERAVADADVVVSAVSLHSVRQVMTEDWLAPDSLIVPIDYATFCHADVARHAALFLVDDRSQFLKNRDEGEFEDYPDPTATIGEAILAGTARPEHGRVVVSHLGVGLADVIFGDAIVTTAERAAIGTLLPS
jgi:ornithine cyclodeaminase/alanine dehydrogenase-like protein (mu-crystallin family)